MARMMAGSREVARRVLERVAEGAYATLALSGEMERHQLSARERALCTKLCYGVLRNRLRLDRALAAASERGLGGLDAATLEVMRLGCYQLLFLDHVPARAAVDEAVAAVKRLRGRRMAGFVNAVLRRVAAQGEPPLDDPGLGLPARLSIESSLPLFVVEDALRRFGAEEARGFLLAQSRPAPLWLRLNLLRGTREEALAALARSGCRIDERAAPIPEAARAASGQDLFHSPAYGEGWFTAQDLGAQLVARLLHEGLVEGAGAPAPILDACAGVGGKTTHLSALTVNRVDIDAADLSARKLSLLSDHAHRLGCTRVRSVQADLTRDDAPLRESYAAVLLDAPCSGLGVWRRHPEARWRFQPSQIEGLAALQRRLLGALARRVRPGGVLVYSVCTYTEAEGAAQIEWLLREPASRFAEEARLATWPHRDDADAFFAARLRRVGA